MPKSSQKQTTLFEMKEWWEDEWQDMPEFVQESQKQFKEIVIKFRNREDMNKFMELINQNFTRKTTSIWHPELKYKKISNLRYSSES